MTPPAQITKLSLFAAVGLLALAGCAKKQAVTPTEAPRAVSVARVEQRSLASGLVASGVLISREEAAVGSELSGYRVAKVYVEQGATVKQGQPLVQIDDTLLRAQIDQQAAVTAQAEAEAARVASPEAEGLLSKEQVESRRFSAKAQEAALDALKAREARMTVTAPVGGLVLERNIRPGDIAGGGTTAWFRIARDSLVELQADVSEADLATIKPGDPADVTLPSGAVVHGDVRLIDPSVNADTKLGRVRIRLPVRPDLRPGGFGRAQFLGAGQTASVAPETAVRYDADGASMMVVDATDHVHQTPVKTGRRAGGYVELISGPPPGSRVLLGATAFVLEGDKVTTTEVKSVAAR